MHRAADVTNHRFGADEAVVIRPHGVIRGLGALLGAVVAVPHVIGVVYLLLHPDEVRSAPSMLAIPLAFGSIGSWLTYRWLTISVAVDSRCVRLRGLWRTVVVPTADFGRIETVEVASSSHPGGSTTSSWVLDREGNPIGRIPASIYLCRGAETVLTSVTAAARAARKVQDSAAR